ncbi:MAG TPA: endopeptidase La [Planctomycetota bacterium]|nr:endopeptidase La [Planctomycetota bacterium]
MSAPAPTSTDPLRLLPLIPLRGMVPIPGLPIPLAVGRPSSKAAIEAALKGDGELLLVMQRKPETEEPSVEDLHRVGVVAHLLKSVADENGSITAIVQGTSRTLILGVSKRDDHWLGEARLVPAATAEPTVELEALVGTVRSLLKQLLRLAPNSTLEFGVLAERLQEPGLLADAVAASLPIGREEKQKVLETFDLIERLRLVSKLAGHQVEVMELESKIESQVHGQLADHKRRAILQEQLQAIRKELGEEDDPELLKLREKLAKADLNDEARAVAERELRRLEGLGSGSPERGWIVTYVDWLASLPWTRLSPEHTDVEKARAVLDREHYGLGKVKERILEALAVRKLRPDGRASILCFVGPPGVGKTSLAQAVAEATGRELVRISVGGVSDESEIRGHRRTYVGALPGRILSALRKAGTRNPVFVMDEIDKMAASYHGDPAAALLEVLDPEQNKTFVDRYLEVPFDLSRVLFITTANTLETLTRPLLDRMEVIELPSYTSHEKLQIARRHLLGRQIHEAGLEPAQVEIPDATIESIIEGWTREAGVRSLERQLGAMLRKLALKTARGESGPWTVQPDDLVAYLGPRRLHHEAIERVRRPGVVMGLAWTPVGGEVLFVEAARMPGQARLQLTGNLGDVMKESASAALTWIRSHADEFPGAGEFDYHIHVPAGATPKDGPSAGVAMLAALASVATGRRARHDTAMTGELTLRGAILPVGGIREKVLAAARAGIKTVILPRRNEVDLEDVPEEVRRELDFVLVDRADQVVEKALVQHRQAVSRTSDEKAA